MIEQVGNNRPYHQVKIPRCSNQEVEIFVQRSICRELVRINIYHSKSQLDKCRSLIMLLNSFKSWIKQESQRQYPQKNKPKPKDIQKSPTQAPCTNKILSKILRGFPGWAEPARCPKTIQSAFWKAQVTTGSFSILGCWACLWWERLHISTALYLPNKTCSIEARCFLSILKYFSKSFFANLRGRNKFINSRDETLEHKPPPWKCIQVAAPTPNHTTYMRIGYRNFTQLSTLHCQYEEETWQYTLQENQSWKKQWLLAVKRLKSEPWRPSLNTRHALEPANVYLGKRLPWPQCLCIWLQCIKDIFLISVGTHFS